MGYVEILCQLCGVSFAIGRLRRPDEPYEAAWDYTGSDFVGDEDIYGHDERCGEGTGCTYPERDAPRGGDRTKEHVAGPGCLSACGYNGWRISLEEMKGCRAVQALVPKWQVEEDWKPEDDDQDFEHEGDFFLSGIGDGSPDEGPLENMEKVRHGLDDVLIYNTVQDFDVEFCPPFHPTCFEIFKKISTVRLGKVDVEGLWGWYRIEGTFDEFFTRFPRHPAVARGNEQWWRHEPGCEWIVANPIDIPGLSRLVKATGSKSIGKVIFGWHYKAVDQKSSETHRFPPPDKGSATTDPFRKLSAELTTMVVDYLPSKDIANLRLASTTFRALPYTLFRRLLFEEMPWLWEARDLPIGETDWHELYCLAKHCWLGLKGLQNRKRIWKDVREIVGRIEKYREEGKIPVGRMEED